jgi:glycosyltransferase involved in cell wall biosynthesis
MKIGMFTDTYSPQTNGVVTSVRIYAQELERLGHEVHIFAPALKGDQDDPARVYRFYGIPYFGQPEYRWVFPWAKRGFSLRDFPKLNLDIVHIQTFFGMGLTGMALANRYNVPRIFTYHTFFEPYLHYLPGPVWMYRRLHDNITRIWSNRFPITLCPSRPIKEALLLYGVTRRLELLPTGIDLHNMKPGPVPVRRDLGISNTAPVLATAGRLGREKSFDLLFEAFKLVLAEFPSACLVLMGDGPERRNLETLARNLGIRESIVFTGYVERQKVVDVFAAADLFVFASQSETQGMVLLEAMAQGTPAVAVDALGPGELMQGDKGGLLARPEPGDLAEKIKRLLGDKALYASKKKEAVKMAEEYSDRKLTQKLLGFYEETIRMHKEGKS